MNSNTYYSKKTSGFSLESLNLSEHRKLVIGAIMLVALLAFEFFNFDTTQFALRSLLGDVDFAGLMWATILAVAFCAIDFAGLTRLFTPERGRDEPREVWYLMGAWLLGATMNAVMTWWAVSLTLLNQSFGNEVLSREQLLRYVPIFVAVLVWLTRILFIGALTVAGEHLFNQGSKVRRSKSTPSQNSKSVPAQTTTRTAVPKQAAPPRRAMPAPKRAAAPQQNNMQAAPPPPPMASSQPRPAPKANPMPTTAPSTRVSRIRQRPPVPKGNSMRPPSSIQAGPKTRH
ncbi:MAG: hypothetical protein KDE48_01240 [Anaerolineales bacterium]|nr:hypothetical protein [Anaerolineales bacterium]